MTARRQILTPIVLPLLAAGMLMQSVVPLMRISMTYQAMGQGMGGQAVGLLTAAFSLLPVFLTVPIGRFNDHGAVARATVLGAAAIVVCSLMLALLPPYLWVLLLVSAMLGIGQTLCVSSMQLIALNSSSRAHRDSVLGNFMMLLSLGQAVGPLFIGLAGWVAPLSVAGAVLSFAASVLLLRVVPHHKSQDVRVQVPLRHIVATRGLPWIILTGSIGVTAIDLLLAFMPVLGEARGLTPATIGLLLSIRALASVVSRFVYGRAVRRFGRMRLTLACITLSGVSLALLVFPLPVWVTGIALFAAGFGLGIALTSTVALTMQIAPPAARGTALSMRLTANRIAQFSVPLLAGLAMAPLGAAGIFALAGAALLAAPLARPRGLALSG